MTTFEKTQIEKPVKCEGSILKDHEPKKLRLRALSTEKDSYSKYISKYVAKQISWTQIILGIIICGTQITTMSLVLGLYSYYDQVASIGGGLCSSLTTMSAATVTLWSLKNGKYWKTHLSFAMHVISVAAAILILNYEFGGNLEDLKDRLGDALYSDEKWERVERYNSRRMKMGNFNGSREMNDNAPAFTEYPFESELIIRRYSASMLTVSLILNAFMATGTLIQLLTSFVMMIMTARALYFGMTRGHGQLFELEVARGDNKNDIPNSIKQYQNTLQEINNNKNNGEINPDTNFILNAASLYPPCPESIIISA